MKKISIISPVYNEEANLERFIQRTEAVMHKLKYEYEICLINDGSTDSSEMLIRNYCNTNKKIKLVNLSRNFGHQAAITAGIYTVNGDAIIILDSDLQDPPELIFAMVSEWEKGFQVVNARRISRNDGWLKNLTAKLFYKFLNMVLTNKIPENVGDYRLIDRRVSEVLKELKEKDRYLRGLATWAGFKQVFVDFDRAKRTAGKTNYTWRKMFGLAFDAIFSFSRLPMKLALSVSIFFGIISITLIVYALYSEFTGNTIAGWASIMLMISVLSSLQMFVLAIISEYIGRIYVQTQDRPLYVISDKVNI